MEPHQHIIVKDCIDCPFRNYDFDPDSAGLDTVEECLLARFNKSKQYTIRAYDSWEYDEMPKLETPSWCPLRTGNKIVSLEKA